MPKFWLLLACLTFHFLAFSQELPTNDSTNLDLGEFNFSLKEPKKYFIADIAVSGTQYLDKSAILSLIGLKVGDQISIPGDQITMAVRKLWAQGILGNIEFAVTKVEGDQIYLNIDLQERQRLAKFTFSGIPKEQADDVREKIRLIKGKIVTDALLKNAQNQIKKFYFEKGFLNATVKPSRSVDSTTPNYVSINFNVKKGKRVKIKDIRFIGVTKFTPVKLREKMKGTKKRVWWMVWQTSKLITSKYEEDKKSIIEYYNSEGYRDAQIVRDTVVNLNKKRIRIDIQIEEGNKYYFRNITWKGNYLYDSKFLNSILGVKKGDVYNFQSLEKQLTYNPTGQDISSLYMDDGYLFFNIDPVETKVDGDSIDIELRMYEGPQATIDRVTIAGNTKTSDHVVLREIRTRPGKKFSRSDLIRSQRELSQLGYFDPEKINIQPIPNPEKGTVAINYDLVEKPSDQIQLSGGWGGFTGFVGTLGLVFNNFSARNIFNFKEYNPLPSGDGQRLSLNVQANGPSYQSYSISFAEPWLGGKRPITFSISASHSVQRLGIRGIFGRGLGTNAFNQGFGGSGSLSITNFNIGISRRLRWPDDYFILSHNLSYSVYYLNDYSFGLIQGITNGYFNNLAFNNTLSRNSIDNPTYPRSGSSYSLVLSLTPPYSLFRNVDDYSGVNYNERFRWVEYHKWMLDISQFYRIVGDLVINTRAHMGFLGAYNSSLGVSPFERFVMGGSGLAGFNFLLGYDIIAFRGYQDNSVNSTGSVNGNPRNPGLAYSKFVFELRHPITLNPAASIFVLGFAEAGNSWASYADYNPFHLYKTIGMGARIFMPAFGMLGLDYGWGLDEVPGNPGGNENRFTFTIGQQIR